MIVPILLQGYQGNNSVHTHAMRVFAEHLARQGYAPEVTPKITKLGRNATDVFSLIEAGEIQVIHFAASYLAHRVPAIEVFDLPFC